MNEFDDLRAASKRYNDAAAELSAAEKKFRGLQREYRELLGVGDGISIRIPWKRDVDEPGFNAWLWTVVCVACAVLVLVMTMFSVVFAQAFLPLLILAAGGALVYKISSRVGRDR